MNDDEQIRALPEWNIEEWDDSWLSDATLSPGAVRFLDSLPCSADGHESTDHDGHLSDASSKSLNSSRSTPPQTLQYPSQPQLVHQVHGVSKDSPNHLQAQPLQSIITSLFGQPKLPGMSTLLPAGPLKRSLDGSDSDAAVDDPDCSKRLKPLSRSEKNRMAAANSRAKQKQTMHELAEKVAQQQEELTESRAEIARLRAENMSLRDQVDFFRNLVGDSYRRTLGAAVTDASAQAPAQPGQPSTPRAMHRPVASNGGMGKLGLAVVVMAFACALCALPGTDTGMGGTLGASSGSRGLMSNDPAALQTAAFAAPALPSTVLWSPTTAMSFAIQAFGVPQLARTVLSHVVSVGVVLLLVVMVKRGVFGSGCANGCANLLPVRSKA